MDGFCTYYVKAAAAEALGKETPEAALTWLSASRVCRDFGRPEDALVCAEKALRLDPDNYDIRFLSASLLVDAGKLEDADNHLHWCLLRKPNNKKLRSLVDRAVRRRVARRSY
jgi:predicted Zn-dependent protease